MNSKEAKVLLPRTGPDHFWKTIQQHYAGEDELTWKRLAMVALRENAGWPIELIAAAFGHHKGHVSRSIEGTKKEIRKRFRAEPDFLGCDAAFDDNHGFSDPDRPQS
ncbi:hypothetical protein Pan189_04710 [Stratiformator vulcanicus]|uniref:Uncharacterized protein n=2 Tax=Stratiformator vulcanicus TaxID=2527980 RepID=A0A517QWS0_9PLAN|nr:hypothetical protein Pan189_04710 [Stratiformator vulcanicus]